MLAGILFQLGTMTLFVAVATDFIIRVITSKPYTRKIPVLHAGLPANHVDNIPTRSSVGSSTSTPPATDNDGEKQYPTNGVSSSSPMGHPTSRELRKAELLLLGVAFASIMIYVRGIYRSIELAQGWSGYLITHEPYFNFLDGLPMILCLLGLAIAHPGFLLPKRQGWRNA